MTAFSTTNDAAGLWAAATENTSDALYSISSTFILEFSRARLTDKLIDKKTSICLYPSLSLRALPSLGVGTG